MIINKEGLPLVALTIAGSICFLFVGINWRLPFWAVIGAIGFIKAAFFCYFFRDPERIPPHNYEEGKMILSPADGKVLEIANEAGGAKTIRIFLSVFDVHIQRAPCEGKILKTERKKGKYLAAMNESAHRENEQNIITIETGAQDKIVVKQIVGIIARRLVLWKREGDFCRAAERIGMIKFGSQVDISIPSNYNVNVHVGQKVIAGITKIAQK